MPILSINNWAVLVAALASMVIGYVWYAKPVFGTRWMMYTGMTDDKAKQGAGMALLGMFRRLSGNGLRARARPRLQPGRHLDRRSARRILDLARFRRDRQRLCGAF